MLPFMAFVYIVLSLLVAYAGIGRRVGFWGVLLFSVVCTPFIIFLMLMAFDQRHR